VNKKQGEGGRGRGGWQGGWGQAGGGVLWSREVPAEGVCGEGIMALIESQRRAAAAGCKEVFRR
jgi:hypothetical protein